MLKLAAKIAWKLRERPAEYADEAANMIMHQEIELTKLKYALTQIADGDNPLTVMKSIARQALNRK